MTSQSGPGPSITNVYCHILIMHQAPDELGSTPRELLLSRGGPVQRFDLMARAASLLSKLATTGGSKSHVSDCDGIPAASGTTSEERLSMCQAAVSEPTSSALSCHLWSLKDMRVLLATAGVNFAGVQPWSWAHTGYNRLSRLTAGDVILFRFAGICCEYYHCHSRLPIFVSWIQCAPSLRHGRKRRATDRLQKGRVGLAGGIAHTSSCADSEPIADGCEIDAQHAE